MFRRILVVGASRGLGRSLALFYTTHFVDVLADRDAPGSERCQAITLVSRKKPKLEEVRQMIFVADEKNGRRAAPQMTTVNLLSLDMATGEGQQALAEVIRAEKFDLVIYSAGGGPHGAFQSKEFKDHQWALQVGLVAPMFLVWSWLKCRDAAQRGKFVIVGSRIAEQDPDPLASSYAASKHGLYGFVSSLQSELSANQNKVWLFSPGFMDSEMLPLTAKVRHDGSKLMSTETAAQALLRWIKKDDGTWHRVLN